MPLGSVELARLAIVEADDEFTTVRPESLQRMGIPGGKIPDIGFCGPGSAALAGFLALIAPCGGLSGLPKEAAAAAVVDIAAPAAAVARTSRLENMPSPAWQMIGAYCICVTSARRLTEIAASRTGLRRL
jgi:hypothetical protein